ncbi:MAG: isochorismatase family protein [Gemmatimonas sp.]|nr:isochorismatase family protein [Gemmatimonas sp.]
MAQSTPLEGRGTAGASLLLVGGTVSSNGSGSAPLATSTSNRRSALRFRPLVGYLQSSVSSRRVDFTYSTPATGEPSSASAVPPSTSGSIGPIGRSSSSEASCAASSKSQCCVISLEFPRSRRPATTNGRRLSARLATAGHIIDLPKKKVATVIAGRVIIAPARSIIFIEKARFRYYTKLRSETEARQVEWRTRHSIFDPRLSQEVIPRVPMINPRQHSSDLVFWDVDTQFDFMTPPEQGGRLYVRDPQDDTDEGAIQIAPVLERLSEYARTHDVLRVATGDWHVLEHREIDPEDPDFRTTYPPHCMAGEVGATKIPETALRDPLLLPLGADPGMAWDITRRAVREGRDIFVQKEEFSCFVGNPATDALLQALAPQAIVVYGVALDVCVKYAVEGFLDRGLTVLIVKDATWGLGLEDRETLLAEWERRGAVRITSEQVLNGELPIVPPPIH